MDQPNIVLAYTRNIVPPRWVRLLMNPVGRPFFAAVLIAGLWGLWLARVPNSGHKGEAYIFALGIYLGMRVLVAVTLQLIYKTSTLDVQSVMRWFWRSLAAVLLALGIGLVGGKTDWPRRVTFSISEPFMRRDAEAISTAESKKVRLPGELMQNSVIVAYPSSWAGLYRVNRVIFRPSDGAVIFFVGDSAEGQVGWTYSPKGLPRENYPEDVIRFKPFDKNWFLAIEPYWRI